MAKRRKKRGHSLRRRYGHAGSAELKNVASSFHKLAQENPLLASAALGAAAGIGMGAGPHGALIGGGVGAASHYITKK